MTLTNSSRLFRIGHDQESSKSAAPAYQAQLQPNHFLSREVEFDGPKVYKQVASLLEFRRGQGSMKGPIGQKAMEAKCKSCAFYKKCPHV